MSEANLQSNVIKYLNLQYPSIRYCASLGGQYQRYPSQRNKAKSTGYVKGFPDLGIYEARGSYFGLFLEIKQKGGYPTKEQKQWIEDLNKNGYYACVVKGLDAIIEVIDEYLNKEITISEKGKHKTTEGE
tara:strand:+ start:5840 stop:6229 length:390 start_codon:yes stop_codon:yes gene_type:complete